MLPVTSWLTAPISTTGAESSTAWVWPISWKSDPTAANLSWHSVRTVALETLTDAVAVMRWPTTVVRTEVSRYLVSDVPIDEMLPATNEALPDALGPGGPG